MIKLRPYQKEARDAVLAEWDKGNLNTLCPMSTGTGKTELYLAVLVSALNGGRGLVIAHRQELIYQPKERIRDHWPTLGTPGIVMAGQDEYQANLVIATIQTLNTPGRVERILGAGQIDVLITDEAHHSTAATYVRLYKELREANPDLKHLGVTATPKRTDGTGLATVYDSVAYRFGIVDAIKSGALVPFTAIGVQLPVSISHVREVGDGWDDEELGEVLKAQNAEQIVIETWEKHAKDRPTMAFTASVAQAHSLASRFREYGYTFEALDGTTPKKKRRELLRQFKAGEIQGVVNCAVLTEGFDAPHAACLLQVKPTRSDLVYVQMSGRVLRRAPGKNDALILDFVPEDVREIRLAGDLLGKPKEQRKAEQKAESQGIILGCFGLNSDGKGIDGNPDEVIMKVLDYLSASRLSWTYDGEVASATAGQRATMAITMPDKLSIGRLERANEIRANGEWKEVWGNEYNRVKKWASFHLWLVQGYDATDLGYYETWAEACDSAEDYVEEYGLNVLSKRNASWRRKPASDKQRSLCIKFGIWKVGMSRGEAAQRLTHFFARRTLRI